MVELVLIVEGHGDVEAMPHLVGKIGAWLELPLYTVRPVRAQGWGAIKKEGGLEKLVGLAASRDGCSRIVVCVDLDDDCPVVERNAMQGRVDWLQQLYGVVIEVCFCIREFEAWLLASTPELATANVLKENASNQIENHSEVRDAKGLLRSLLRDGYSAGSDQGELSKLISPSSLYARDRSFRRFVKSISSLQYYDLESKIF